MLNKKMPAVLVIDDVEDIRDIFRRLLERRNYTVLAAEDGRKGLEIFQREKPDVVLVDLRMKGVDGLDVLARVREWSPETPVIVVSATGVIQDAIEALRLGACDYLLKPIRDPSVLYHAVEKALDRARLLHENQLYQQHLEEEVNKKTEELEKANKELVESEEKFRLLVENQENLIIKFDTKGQLLFVSPSYCKTFGKNQDELLGENFLPTVHEEDREKVAKAVKNISKPPHSTYVEERALTKKGWRWFAWLNTGILDKDHKVSAIVGVGKDITERKKAEEERQKLEARLRQTQKMEAIGSLAGGIAHDFNNLLTVINGHAEIALTKLKKNHPQYKDIRAILQAGKQAENLTTQLLAFSRRQIYNPKVIDINKVISNLDKMMRRLIGEDICMEVKYGSVIPKIKADPGQIEQILMNLILNARDAVTEWTDYSVEKRITIETGEANLDEAFAAVHAGSKTGLHLFLTVSDNGIGMTEETKSKIFEPFYTTKEKGKGTGLGMSTVYGIVKQNNGNIYVYSEPGKGSTFKIYWPAALKKKGPKVPKKPKKEVLTGTESILLVEDDEAVRDFAAESLRQLGYEVFEAATGKKALQLLKEKNLQVDLVFTDLIMPEVSGWELAEKLKEISPKTAVLYTSGYTDDHIIKNGVLEQGIHFVNKPFSFHALAKKVREVLDSYPVRRRK